MTEMNVSPPGSVGQWSTAAEAHRPVLTFCVTWLSLPAAATHYGQSDPVRLTGRANFTIAGNCLLCRCQLAPNMTFNARLIGAHRERCIVSVVTPCYQSPGDHISRNSENGRDDISLLSPGIPMCCSFGSGTGCVIHEHHDVRPGHGPPPACVVSFDLPFWLP